MDSRRFRIKLVAALSLAVGSALASTAFAGPRGSPLTATDAAYVPVAKRPRGEVLAKGAEYIRSDLTRGVVNDYRDLLGWILSIKFTDAQCEEFEQRMITRWPRLLRMDTDEITGASKQNAQIRAMPPAQLKATHKNLQETALKNLRDMVGGALMLDNFRAVSDDDRREAQWLLAIYEDQHPEAVAPMPAMTDVPAAADQPMVEPQSNADGKSDQLAATRKRIAEMRAMQQLDIHQRLQLQQLERMQQMQNQQINMMSNIARSAHETNMRIIDNMGPTRHPWDR